MKKSFRELDVWQASLELTVLVYRLTSDFPNREIYGLTAQMRRAAISINSNIAEGAGRNTRRDFRHFVLIARGSACELEAQLLVALRLGYCSPEQVEATERLLAQVGRMLNGLSRYLEIQIKSPRAPIQPVTAMSGD